MDTPDISKLAIDRSATPVRRRRRRWWPWAVAALVLAALAGMYLRGNTVAVETVAVTTAYPSQAVTALNATGYVVAQRKAAVASKATGRLEWLGVMEGTAVKKDQVIARLENRDVSASRDQAAANVGVAAANLEQARAEARDADANLARSRDLAEKKYISGSTLDTAVARADKARAVVRSGQAALGAARANLKAAEVALDQTLIRAPFDGVVLTKSANVGDNITPFSSAADTKGAVVTIADMDTLEVEADVAESSLAKVRVGQPCEVQLDALPERRFAAVVNRVVPTVDRAKATVLVKIRLVERDPRIVPEMAAKIAFLEREVSAAERKPVPAVPKSAVVERDGGKYVFLVKDGRAQRIPAENARPLGDFVQLEGVKPGERVIVKPLERLEDGMAVR
ncbi:MAG TPA: efflux RND transporter periplasmic adaptor subunit [Burkholderiales bacterium]|nr:efflux RND transporter periplasmic adaptor subunit [Burkholderiales bacterium]